MNDIIIRNVLEEDIKKVVEIQIDGWQNSYKGIIDDDFLNNMNYDELVERRMKDYQKTGFIVAVINKEIVGFCRYIAHNIVANEDDGIDCEIVALYVKTSYKGKGIGKKLFRYVINEFKKNGKEKMVIWCLKENYPARKFYEKMGGKIETEHNINFGGKEYAEVGFTFLI